MSTRLFNHSSKSCFIPISYDEKEDILYLAKKGSEEEVVEIAPGINVDLDLEGKFLGVEIFNASKLLIDCGYIAENQFQAVYNLAAECRKQIKGFRKYLRNYDSNRNS